VLTELILKIKERDQGMMFGYATNETENHAIGFDLSQIITRISYS
jgi:S-adenosylmethionine synthetase